jgi:hypothetical protein
VTKESAVVLSVVPTGATDNVVRSL